MTPEDIGSHLHYDEQVAIENYVLRNYAHWLTESERSAMENGLALWWSGNLERMHEWGAKTRTRSVAPPWEPAPFDPAHADQVGAIVRRLRTEHGEHIRIRRCGACDRVARGPEEEQCPWCRATDRWVE
jgi:hypothetical protein